MSLEENKAIVRRFREAFFRLASTEDLSFVDEFISPNYVSERRGIRGPEEYKQRIIDNRNSFMTDAEGTTEEMIAEGDKVVVRGTYSGTHTGTLRGIAPTGKRWTVGAVFIYYLADGKIVDQWVLAEWDSMYRQIGAYPPLEE